MNDEIPREVEEKYAGQWIAWDTESKVVLASGETMEDLVPATRGAVDAGKLIWFRHILRPDTVLVGGAILHNCGETRNGA